jgi:ATP-dependent DNA helicase RecG
VLLYRQGLSSQAKSRLQIMRDYQDGFQIADADLKLRGAGEMMGKRQSGAMLFRVADLQKDEAMVELAQQLLGQMQGDAVQALARRWQSVYHESTLGV